MVALEGAWGTEYKSPCHTVPLLFCFSVFIRCYGNALTEQLPSTRNRLFLGCSLQWEHVLGEHLASHKLPLWFHYSGFQASCHNMNVTVRSGNINVTARKLNDDTKMSKPWLGTRRVRLSINISAITLFSKGRNHFHQDPSTFNIFHRSINWPNQIKCFWGIPDSKLTYSSHISR
jgi:hypothetical protein